MVVRMKNIVLNTDLLCVAGRNKKHIIQATQNKPVTSEDTRTFLREKFSLEYELYEFVQKLNSRRLQYFQSNKNLWVLFKRHRKLESLESTEAEYLATVRHVQYEYA